MFALAFSLIIYHVLASWEASRNTSRACTCAPLGYLVISHTLPMHRSYGAADGGRRRPTTSTHAGLYHPYRFERVRGGACNSFAARSIALTTLTQPKLMGTHMYHTAANRLAHENRAKTIRRRHTLILAWCVFFFQAASKATEAATRALRIRHCACHTP